MAFFIVNVFVATQFSYQEGWEFPLDPTETYLFESEEEAFRQYNEKDTELSTIAAVNNKAVKILLLNNNVTGQSHMYEGENVKNWKAAYQAGDRYFIDYITMISAITLL